MLLGLLGALIAAVSYGAATTLQAVGVRSMAAVPSGASLVVRVRSARAYGAGLALDAVGFLASIAALRSLPLFLVQSAIASSVAVTAGLAVLLLKTRLRRSEVIAIGVTLLGLVLLAVSAREGSAQSLSSGARWAILGLTPVLGLALAAGLRDRNDQRASVVLATTCGLGFGFVGISARVLEVRTPWWHTAADPSLWAIAIYGGIALTAYGYALHRGRVTTVASITFAVETVIPAAIGLAFLGDAFRAHFAPIAVLGFIATLGASIALATHAEPAATDD